MGRRERGAMSRELIRTREQFEAWCAAREPGDRIPARLWKQAVQLAAKVWLDSQKSHDFRDIRSCRK